MQSIAVICEYNPFHFGHTRQLSRLRAEAPDAAIVCLMSGCFTQRGEPALLPPYDRARAAVLCGADLVLELPQPWASGSAEYFAAGGVAAADRLGCVEALSFGCETEDLEAPMRTASRLAQPAFAAALAEARTVSGEGEAARVARLYAAWYGSDGGMLSRPNNLLAVSYCRALAERRSSIVPRPMQRDGSAYDDPVLCGGHSSATAIRAALRAGTPPGQLADCMPAPALSVLCEAIAAGRAPVFFSHLEQAVLAFYRLADAEALSRCASMGGGLQHRLCRAAREAESLADMLRLAATRVYPTARLQRAILHGMLGVTEADLRGEPEALLLLAASARGRELLAYLRRSAARSVAIVTKPADLRCMQSPRLHMLRERAEALYTLAFSSPRPAGVLTREMPYFGD